MPAAGPLIWLRAASDLHCRVTLQWRVEDADRLWKGTDDPVGALRRKVAETVRGFFASRSSERLLEDPALLEQDLADRVPDRGITIIQNGLEQQVSQQARVPGLRIDAVSAAIVPSALLADHLRRLIEKVWGPGGLADRRKTDRLLDLDQTYAPYKVRDVARFLDLRLLENFYSRPWPEAMAELAAAFAAKKAEYLRSSNTRRRSGRASVVSIVSGQPQAQYPCSGITTVRSGVSIRSQVAAGCPFCPPGLRPRAWRWERGAGFLNGGSEDGGGLALWRP